MKEQIHALISAYHKKAEKLRAKAEKNIYDNRAYIAYNSEADILECVIIDLKAIVKCKDCGLVQCTCHEPL